ncbi:synthetic antigen [Cryptosporidium sp. chipmunk genotype I]|uniref:synthetic antigen n=1 Tax=Cryptosporidium sp. chipmunk genotype I TaxID=1280935 RepID=UPI00351A1108|nr:synthetic antigen [Cryptosporidium sp. chipmunk genotype I]
MNANTDDFNILEEEADNQVKSKKLQSKHPKTGFPAVYNRKKLQKNQGNSETDGRKKSVGNEDYGTKTPLVFNFTQNDILKLRWTNPLGEDVDDWESTGKSDMNLHSLRFDFEGYLCDNSNSEEKCKSDDLYFYKGLHHHSDQGEFEGYTIPELMHLSRSSNISQRCIAIRTLGNIFVKIREYHTFNHEFGKAYHKYLLGYLFGIHRWYRYLTGDLSIHYLLMNMLFHESYASRTAENSVIALNNLLTGGQFPIRSIKNNMHETCKFKLLSYFLTPSEFVFELLDEKLAYFPSYFRYSIISQRLEFLTQLIQKQSHNIRYNDLQDEEHLIKFDLPDGRSLELLRDTMQEIFKYVPTKYDKSELSIQKNYLFIFLCKMAQNKNGSLDSRISSISIIRLFIQRECIYDHSICLETLENMLNVVGDEVFDFSSSELASQDYSNSPMAKLLFSFIYLISTYAQSLYNSKNDIESKFIKAQNDFLNTFLVKSVLPILRIAILAVLDPGKLHSSGISEFIQLSFVEGVKLIGIMTLKNIFLEDLSIFCKDLIHYLTFVDLSDSIQTFIIYHLYGLGCNLLVFSKGHGIEYEHLQFVQVLNQLIGKIHEKFRTIRSDFSLGKHENLGFVLLSVAIIRFQVLLAERSDSSFSNDNFDSYFELINFCESYLETHSKKDFNIDLLTLESGFLLEIEMGSTNSQSILSNNKTYQEFYSIILISTFLKEISRIYILTGKGEEAIFSNFKELKPSYNLLSEMYQKFSIDYILSNYTRKDNSDFYSKSNQLFSYELCYFEALNMNDGQAVVANNNVVKKNSIYLQVLNSNIFYIYLLLSKCTEHVKDRNTVILGSSAPKSSKVAIYKYNKLISEIENSSYDSKILYEKLFMLLFGSKNLEEYSIALFWILKLENQISEPFNDFYNKVLEEYSSFFDNSNLLIFNPFIYSVNIVYCQIKTEFQEISSRENPFLLSIMKKVMNKQLLSLTNSKLMKDLIDFLSKYIFECSINQVINISRAKDIEIDSINCKLIGSTILNYLKFSLELQNYVHIHIEECNKTNENFQDFLLEMAHSWRQNKDIANTTMYNLNSKTDNECLLRLIDSLISAFCDTNIYFPRQVLDCFYFLFTFLIFETISDGDFVLKILSNIKIMKFLLYHDMSDVSHILGQVKSLNTKVAKTSSNEKIISLLSEIIALYKDSVCKNTLLVLLVLYLSYFSGSKLELIEEITRLYKETKVECLKHILDILNKN